jgi:hypothetical protein
MRIYPWAALVALGLSQPAFALDPYMWGVGPKLGTNAIPGRFPATFNTTVRDDAAISRVGFDLIVGADAYYYTSSRFRMGLTAHGDFGGHFWDIATIAKAHAVIPTGDVDLLVGGGLGAGYLRFGGATDTTADAAYSVPYYPFRGEAAVLIRDDTRGYGLTIFAEYKLPSSQRYFNAAGVEVPSADIDGIGFWGTLGLEGSVLFGDFEPPRPRRRNK